MGIAKSGEISRLEEQLRYKLQQTSETIKREQESRKSLQQATKTHEKTRAALEIFEVVHRR